MAETEHESGFKAHPPSLREPAFDPQAHGFAAVASDPSHKSLDMLQRDAFLAAFLQQFAGRTEIGDGELFRTLRELQRQHFRPPAATHLPHKFPQTAEA
jgi:hypothetical protein